MVERTLMSVRDVDGLNVGYAQALLEQYLENPEAVPEEWRTLFESGDAALVEALPGLARLFETLKEENGAPAPVAEVADAAEAPPPAPPPEPEPVPEPVRPPEPTVSGRARPDASRRRLQPPSPSSRPTGLTATWRRTSTRSAPIPSATRRSSRSS